MVDPSLLKRKIIHFDMDAYYASIEVRDNPRLQGIPVVIGGSPASRAVVCTASYEARKFGIRSAMPCSQAARLCPEAIFIPPNFEKYSAVSRQIREIFKSYSPKVEPLSLDEAYIDVTDHLNGRYAVKIAKLIQDEVYSTTHLTGSAGVAPNKLLAKIASDFRKPNGLTAILPTQVLDFMGPLPLRKIHGVGPVSEKHLLAYGFKYCRDLWPYGREELINKVGSSGNWLYDASRGIDEREVETTWLRKSFGREQTFSKDLTSLVDIKASLDDMTKELSEDIKRENIKGRTITLKLRYSDFTRITRSRSLANPTHDANIIFQVLTSLLDNTEAGIRKVRLAGVAVSNLEDSESL